MVLEISVECRSSNAHADHSRRAPGASPTLKLWRIRAQTRQMHQPKFFWTAPSHGSSARIILYNGCGFVSLKEEGRRGFLWIRTLGRFSRKRSGMHSCIAEGNHVFSSRERRRSQPEVILPLRLCLCLECRMTTARLEDGPTVAEGLPFCCCRRNIPRFVCSGSFLCP